MLATLSKLNISCSCTECNNFLLPFSKNPPPIQLPPDLLPSTLGLGFSLPPTPAATPAPFLKGTPHSTAPTLAPSPAFLLTRSHSHKRCNSGPLALPSLSLSPPPISSLTSGRVALASRSLWAHISSPISECSTPLSAETPELSACAQTQCSGKAVPGVGRTVCEPCESELRGAVLGLSCVMADDFSQVQQEKKGIRAKLNRADSGVVLGTAVSATAELPVTGELVEREAIVETELELFAVPSTPPSTKLLITHSRTQSLTALPRQTIEEGAPTLFALPNTSLNKSFAEFTPTTPTTRYAQDFPDLPLNSKPENSKDASVKELKRSSKDVEGLARALSKNGRRKEGQTGSKTATKRNSKTR
ncbi:hypothetical protein E8E11_003613 [Didymella keratinophila]|nr:hypothetical protein E8E11_003613 [Didymella keratinophila]